MSKVYPLAKIQKRVVGNNVTEVWTIQVGAYGKPVKDAGAQAWVTANEFICSSIGTALGLPIPPFAMLEKSVSGTRESLWFSTLSYSKEGENLPPITPSIVYSNLPDICAGVVVFDLWIANTDRHEGNLSYDPNVTPKRLNVFDHSHALFGLEGPGRLPKLRDVFTLTETCENGANRHCLMDEISDPQHLEKWLKRIHEIPLFQLTDACSHALDLGLFDAAEKNSTLDFLQHRRTILRDLLQKNWNEFTAAMSAMPLF